MWLSRDASVLPPRRFRFIHQFLWWSAIVTRHFASAVGAIGLTLEADAFIHDHSRRRELRLAVLRPIALFGYPAGVLAALGAFQRFGIAPLQRVLESSDIPDLIKEQLRSQLTTLNPFALQLSIKKKIKNILKQATPTTFIKKVS